MTRKRLRHFEYCCCLHIYLSNTSEKLEPESIDCWKVKTTQNSVIAIIGTILHVPLSLFLAILMSEKPSEINKEITAEEKQFTDLLFGDLEEVSIPVSDLERSNCVEANDTKRRKAKGTSSLMARF